MTTNFIKSVGILSLLTFSACRYSDEFTGTFNQKPATLSAYSKNIDKECISLSLKSDSETRNSAISAKSVFDENDLLHGKSFNTKGEPCSAKLNEYLVGNRSTKIVNTVMNGRETLMGGNLCQVVYYPQYFYQDTIQFEFRNTLSDQTTGSFAGIGQVSSYIDYSRPSGFGPIYPCNGGFPGPHPGYPYPVPGYPHPFSP